MKIILKHSISWQPQTTVASGFSSRHQFPHPFITGPHGNLMMTSYWGDITSHSQKHFHRQHLSYKHFLAENTSLPPHFQSHKASLTQAFPSNRFPKMEAGHQNPEVAWPTSRKQLFRQDLTHGWEYAIPCRPTPGYLSGSWDFCSLLFCRNIGKKPQ